MNITDDYRVPMIKKPNKNINRYAYLASEMKMLKATESFKKWNRKQFLSQGGTCYYCDIPLKAVRENIEHIIPKSQGGNNSVKNLVLACWVCNKKKGSKTLSLNQKRILKQNNKLKSGTYKKYLKFEEYLAYYIKEMIRE